MCKLKSGIILKDRVFIPDYESHTDMLEELNIDDTKKNAGERFVRVELRPEGNDIFTPIDTWKFWVDQEVLPDWFVPEFDRERMVEAVGEWADSHIYTDKSNFSVSGGTFYLKNCKNVACDNSEVWAFDNSTVRAYGNSEVRAYGNNEVRAWGDSKVNAWSESKVMAFNNSKVVAYDNSEVTAYGNSEVRAYGNNKVRAYGNSKVRAYGNNKVTACGDSRVMAYDNSEVKAYENSEVVACDNSLVIIPFGSTNKDDNITLMGDSTLKNCNTDTIYQSGNRGLIRDSKEEDIT